MVGAAQSATGGPRLATVYFTPQGAPYAAAPATSYWRSPTRIDPRSLEHVNAAGERFFNPSTLGALALPEARGDFEERRTRFNGSCNQRAPLTPLQRRALTRIAKTAVRLGDGVVWRYDFPMRGADYVIAPPYPSAFAQAINIHALLLGYCKTGGRRMLDLAGRGGLGLMTPIDAGGAMNARNGITWYEELVAPEGFAPYILNGHVYSVLALYMLADATGDARFAAGARRGVESLDRLLPLFDTGDWTKYDLRPPSPSIYIEAAPAPGVTLRSITVAPPDGESFTLCRDGPCTATLASASADGVYRFNANLPSLRRYRPGQIDIALTADADGPVQFFALPRRADAPLRPVRDNRLRLQDMGWGQTSVQYHTWHAVLMEELASWTGDETHAVTARRWRSYLSALPTHPDAS